MREPVIGGNRKWTIVLVLALVVIAGLIGWWIGAANNPNAANNSGNPTQTPSADTEDANVKSLAGYTLPQGWRETACPAAKDVVLLVPPGAPEPNCNSDQPTAPIKIFIDPQNRTDCNELQNVQNVKKHTCKSLFIDGRKTLQAETIYNKESSYKEDTRIAAYYINTGKGVVKLEYTERTASTPDDYQEEFDQLVNSIDVK